MPTTSTNPTTPHDHAIVLGGSMAGLATARALARHFRRVTIVERDALASRPAGRPGVPQAPHLHVLLPGGAAALESLMPGFAAGLLGAGAVPIDAPTELLWLNPAGWITPFPARHRVLSASRDLIEWHTRRLVAADPAITISTGLDVRGLCLSGDGRRITGIHVRPTAAAGEGSTIDGDLVVDASGRRSLLPDWLAAVGYERPAETRIDAHLAYATRVYRRPTVDHGWKAIFLQSRPPEHTRIGVLFPIEDDRWMLTLQGVGGDRPPTDEAGFDEFMAGLRSTAIRDAVAGAEALTDPLGFANTANRRRHYDRLRRWPERLLAVGDSACAFNPVYGQGMSVAAQTAEMLDRELHRHARLHRDLDGFARRVQRRVAKAGDAAWLIATGDDLRLSTTTGATASAATRMQHRYLDRALAAATTDEDVLAATLEAFFLLAPPTTLMRPRVLARVARHRPSSAPSTPPYPIPTPVLH